jgi:predicted ATPase with chaperone activity
MDRIDIHVEVPAMELKDLTGTSVGEPSASIRERVNSRPLIAIEAVQRRNQGDL